MRSGWLGVGVLWRQRRRRAVVVAETVRKPAERAAAENLGVLPPLAEHRFHVADRGAPDSELYVVPGWSRPVHGSDRQRLRVAPVRGVVAPTVAQVDAPQEGDVELGPVAVAQDHELLVV